MDSGLVTIIIPYFNKQSTINRTISSVINQTYLNWELIIIDDASKYSLMNLNLVTDSRIVLLSNDVNMGPGPTRQKGLNLAKGDFVAFLDADDWWEKSFLQKQLESLNNNEDAIASWCLAMIYSAGFPHGELRRFNQINHDDIINTLLKYGHSIQTSAYLWRRKQCGNWGFLTTNQDSYFEYSSALNNSKIIKTDEVLLFRDETGDEHRAKYVNIEKQYKNSFDLYCFVYDSHMRNLKFVQKIYLFNRYLNSYYKILKKTELDCGDEFLKRFSLITRILNKNILLIRVTLNLLNKSMFKIY